MHKKQKIVVLGGGVAALSAAFYLTEEKGAAETYDITVYQQGWRLGGKCASGHDLRPGYGHRIYEHGLHIFAGFYDQAFDLLRRAYDVLDRPDDHPNKTVWDAFTPQDNIALVDKFHPDYPMWFFDFVPNLHRPGDDLEVAPILVMIQRMVALLVQGAPTKSTRAPRQPHLPRAKEGPLERMFDDAFAWLSGFVQKTREELEAAAHDLILGEIEHYLEEHMLAARQDMVLDRATEIEFERFLLSLFLVQAVIRGIREDDVINKGYDHIDRYEWSEWIYKHAVEVARRQDPRWGDPDDRARQLIEWTPISSLYDYVFGFQDADVAKPNFAAGTALRSGFLLISYRGHFFWKMRGAMGDVVIAPLYLALLKRGVKFRFFSRVTALNIDPAAPHRLASIDYVEQAALKDPGRGYQPLIEVPIPGWPETRPLEGWPAEPLWDQLADGAAIAASGRNFETEHAEAPGPDHAARQLVAGVDFDKAILGISVGGLKQVCASFPKHLPHSNWRKMFETLTLTRTCAMQLWLTRTMDDLGASSADRTLTGAAQPYSAWSDMSHLLSREIWDGPHRPRALAYFCGQVAGPENGVAADAKAYKLAVEWLSANANLYWTRATSPASPYSLDPKLIYDPEPGAPGDVLTRQYIRANCAPSDLYVQSPKGSVYFRMDAHESGLANLFLTGDWTHNGINSGCAESAARSGYRCANAVAGRILPMPT